MTEPMVEQSEIVRLIARELVRVRDCSAIKGADGPAWRSLAVPLVAWQPGKAPAAAINAATGATKTRNRPDRRIMKPRSANAQHKGTTLLIVYIVDIISQVLVHKKLKR
jgi:hypothetical protein